MSFRVIVEADGGSRGNPGPAGLGALVLDAATGEVLAEHSEFLGVATNNVAEYGGLIAGLRAAASLGASDVAVRMDSKLVIEQMRGTWRVKHPGLGPLHREARELAESFESVTFEWIPRARNASADRLANQAMDTRSSSASVRATAPDVSGPPSPDPAPTRPSWTPPTGARTRLILVRHASTAHSGENRLSGRNDLPLDAAGRAQAAALAVREFGTVAAVLSSPLRRARETAEVIAAARGLDVIVNAELTEVDFGAFEGLTMAEAAERFPDEVRAWRASVAAAPPGGESFAAAALRVERAREEIVAAYPGASVLVVSHVTPIKLFVRDALAAPMDSLFRMFLDTASVSRIDYVGAAPSLRVFNDTSHLHAPQDTLF